MKKILCMVMVLMMLAVTAAAGAEGELKRVYDAAAELLFETENVTITGEAKFSLDGQWFKTAEAEYIQSGENSLWKLDLTSPRMAGGERKNGFTVIANGEKIYVMEVFNPGVYRTGYNAAQKTILRRSVQMDLMADLLQALAEQADVLLGKDAVTVAGGSETGEEIRIQLDENVPEIINTAINLIAQFAAKRYFELDYDRVSERTMSGFEDYLTPTEGILGTTKYGSLQKADVRVKLDSEGQAEEVSGEAAVMLHTGYSGDKLLEVSFSAKISGRGTSQVKAFSPSEYNVQLQEPEQTLYDPEAFKPDEETAQQYMEAAKAAWEKSGFTIGENMTGNVWIVAGSVYVDFVSEDGSAYMTYLANEEGVIGELYNVNNEWQEPDIEYSYDPYTDEKAVQEAAEKALKYLEEIDPEVRKQIDKLQAQWWCEQNGKLFICFTEDPIAQEWDGVMIIVQAQPEWRVEYYSIISNG